MRYLLPSLALCFSAALAAPATDQTSPKLPEANSANDDQPVIMARVGPDVITVADFMDFLAKNSDRLQEATTVEGKARLLRKAIENRLLVQAMLKEGLIQPGASQTEVEEALPKLADKHYPPPPVPDDDSLKGFYQSHIEDFGIPSAVRLSQIQIRVPETETDEEWTSAQARAQAALERLEAGDEFGTVAAEVTDNSLAAPRNGDIGFVQRYGNRWLEQALQGVRPGQHTGVLPSPVGYDIIVVTDTREAVLTPFEDARAAVAERVREQARLEARTAYVKELAKLSGVTIELDELKDAYPNGIFP